MLEDRGVREESGFIVSRMLLDWFFLLLSGFFYFILILLLFILFNLLFCFFIIIYFINLMILVFFLVIFSNSEFDQKLYEDETVNRMHESIMLFAEICNCQVSLSFFLFLVWNESIFWMRKSLINILLWKNDLLNSFFILFFILIKSLSFKK